MAVEVAEDEEGMAKRAGTEAVDEGGGEVDGGVAGVWWIIEGENMYSTSF
jgi:hypothetical protein